MTPAGGEEARIDHHRPNEETQMFHGKFVSVVDPSLQTGNPEPAVMHLVDAIGDAFTINIAAGATVTINGNPAKLAVLQTGDRLELDGDPVTSIAATR